mmetsp:Transcript_160672/g.293491  ORF Transcript_160672/g.293491 Transcript_160672/m.293491 type:complete len:256 (-) Transcript_160672:536-1303(-)
MSTGQSSGLMPLGLMPDLGFSPCLLAGRPSRLLPLLDGGDLPVRLLLLGLPLRGELLLNRDLPVADKSLVSDEFSSPGAIICCKSSLNSAAFFLMSCSFANDRSASGSSCMTKAVYFSIFCRNAFPFCMSASATALPSVRTISSSDFSMGTGSSADPCISEASGSRTDSGRDAFEFRPDAFEFRPEAFEFRPEAGCGDSLQLGTSSSGSDSTGVTGISGIPDSSKSGSFFSAFSGVSAFFASSSSSLSASSVACA